MSEIADLKKDNDKLRQWINDLHSGMYINCVYCGHRYGPKGSTLPTMSQILKDHIEACPNHPMSLYKKKLKDVEKWYAEEYPFEEGVDRVFPWDHA